jgi:autotransporter-associated beta strand protein
VNAGTLTLSGGNALPDASAITVSAAGILKLANSESVGGLDGSGTVNLQNNVLTIGGGSSTTFSGAIIGTGGSLVKTGSATLTLSGVNTFTAGTTLSQGTIQVGNNQAFGIGAMVMSGGRVSSDSATARSLSNALTLSLVGSDGMVVWW